MKKSAVWISVLLIVNSFQLGSTRNVLYDEQESTDITPQRITTRRTTSRNTLPPPNPITTTRRTTNYFPTLFPTETTQNFTTTTVYPTNSTYNYFNYSTTTTSRPLGGGGVNISINRLNIVACLVLIIIVASFL